MQSPLTKYFVTVLRTQGPYREDPPVHMALRAYIPMGARPLSNVHWTAPNGAMVLAVRWRFLCNSAGTRTLVCRK